MSRDRIRRSVLGGLALGLSLLIYGRGGFVAGFVAGVFVNEASELGPWFARKIVTLSLRRASVEESEATLGEWLEAIDATPGKVTKVLKAFDLIAARWVDSLAVRLGRTLVNMRTEAFRAKLVIAIVRLIRPGLLIFGALVLLATLAYISNTSAGAGVTLVLALALTIYAVFNIAIGGLTYLTSAYSGGHKVSEARRSVAASIYQICASAAAFVLVSIG